MPSYGISPAARGMKSWSWAERRLAESHNYWVTTVHPDGRPNSTAVWGIWRDGVFWFSCAPDSRKAKNLRANPNCTITTERADEAVIVEGVATPMLGRAKNEPFTKAYKKKYDWTMDPDGDGYFVVAPRVAFVFVEHDDQFAQTATRYDFPSRRATRKRPTSL
jgi:general stress protein 26